MDTLINTVNLVVLVSNTVSLTDLELITVYFEVGIQYRNSSKIDVQSLCGGQGPVPNWCKERRDSKEKVGP